MASFIKVKTEKDVRMLIKHNNRERDCSTNPDIDEERSKNNYSLLPKWLDNYELFHKRKEQLYYRKNDNMVNALACIITAPKDLDSNQYKEFFNQCFEFLNHKFGSENCFNCVVHMDEETPHLHYLFIPAVEDKKMHKESNQKIAAKSVMCKSMLRSFHPELNEWLHEHNIDANVMNGATKGGNRTVRQLKEERTFKQEYEFSRW